MNFYPYASLSCDLRYVFFAINFFALKIVLYLATHGTLLPTHFKSIIVIGEDVL